MRIIHSADQHLDSDMKTHLPEKKARERRAETLNTFVRMVEYAVENDVAAILLSGDLFDTVSVNKSVQSTVMSLIKNNADITFFYLRGNHDNRSFLSSFDVIPDNLKTFDNEWTIYRLGERIAVSGIELNVDNASKIYDELNLNEDNINICMLHGQVSQAQSDININISKLSGKYIDYLALGHIHSFKEDKIDARGTWCYSGCLEGRGFDEAGDKGFVLLDVDEVTGRIDNTFIPFADRKIEHFVIDISEDTSSVDIDGRINDVLLENNVNPKSIVDIRLVGNVDENADIDITYLTKRFELNYYYVRIKNRTNVSVDINKYINDMSLKGEFIRTVLGDEKLSSEEKGEIISFGLKALKKENISEYIIDRDEF